MSTPERYFGGAPNAFTGGMAYGAELRKKRLQENALNALIGQYGPEAADPESAAAMQAIAQRAAMNPLTLADAQRKDAAQAAAVQAYGPMTADPESRAAQTHDEAARLAASRRAAAVLTHVKAAGGDVGKAFDNVVQPILSAIGMPVEHLGAIRDAVVNDPETVDEVATLLADPEGHKALSGGQPMYNNKTGALEWVVPTAEGARAIPGYTPANAQTAHDRLVQGNERIDVARAGNTLRSRALSIKEAEDRGFKAPPGYQIEEDENGVIHATPQVGSKQEVEQQASIEKADEGDRTFLRSAELMKTNANVVRENAKLAMDYFNSAGGGLILQNLRRGAPLVPGTPMYNAYRALQNVQNRMALETVDEMRKSSKTGSTGFGRFTQSEFDVLKNAQGNLSQTNDPKILVSTLREILDNYDKIEGYASNDAALANERLSRRSTQYPNQNAPRLPSKNSTTTEPSLDDLLNKYAPIKQ